MVALQLGPNVEMVSCFDANSFLPPLQRATKIMHLLQLLIKVLYMI